jgi:hypothetical protein
MLHQSAELFYACTYALHLQWALSSALIFGDTRFVSVLIFTGVLFQTRPYNFIDIHRTYFIQKNECCVKGGQHFCFLFGKVDHLD